MSAFKQFLSTDVTVVPFVVNKSFTFEGTASFEAAGIKKYYGLNVPFNSQKDILSSSYQDVSASLIFNSVKQLYYTNYIITPSQSQAPPVVNDYNGNLIEDYTQTATNARFYNYEQTTLFQSNSTYFNQAGINPGITTLNQFNLSYFPRSFASDQATIDKDSPVLVLSIPKSLFGDYILPNSFSFKTWMLDPNKMVGDLTNYNQQYKFSDINYQNRYGGQGFIFRSGSGIANLFSPTTPVGIINYQHGTIVMPINGVRFLTGSTAEAYLDTNANDVTCSFQSSRTIYETQYKCTIRPDEFNYSLNPSSISGSTDGTPYNFVTGSYFAPYITTVGLYNERQELLAVAKLAQPLPTSRTTDTTIIVNLDM